MSYHLYIVNRSDGPFKVPFKEKTPYEIMEKVSAVIPMGKKCLIPSSIVEYIDKGRLDYHVAKREIHVIEKKITVPRVGIEPQRKLSESKPKKEKVAGMVKAEREAE
jgi:hypothetical protein